MVADPSAISRLCLFWLQKVCNSLEIGSATDRRLVGDQSATKNSVSGLSTTAATGRWLVANQSPTSRQLVGEQQKLFYDRFDRWEVSLAATKTSLRPNRSCNPLQPVNDLSSTSLQLPCNLPSTNRNFGCKEVADRLQATCDQGFMKHTFCPAISTMQNPSQLKTKMTPEEATPPSYQSYSAEQTEDCTSSVTE